ncbi:MAG: hypothetical protein KZQ99_02085 [Candidatus Thiodiazotropha sp. (ex Dulcina madagascariensis)]|nr:hypothetical protein [Candidatus Thiodiazotropha sp. (ex Epidulcina cf. delphinae)]MCU7933653.1 hypothetical protein [Candidatus Thiodiazotropha sp. (ex Dulcina madagascariensis)]
MNGRPIIEEQYKKGSDVINYVVYKSTSGIGNDEVLQHKLLGTTETAHVTLHPDGTVNVRVKRTKTYLENAIRSNLVGFVPSLSQNVKQFISKVRGKI